MSISAEEYALIDAIEALRQQDKGPKFLGIPDSWTEDRTLWRCPDNHVSQWYVKSEIRGAICPACRKIVMITYPGDLDGTPIKGEL